MAYSETLAGRMRDCLDHHQRITEKRMFGGLGFFHHGNMLAGIWKEYLVLRLGYDQATQAVKQPGVQPFNPTGKPMKGWVMIQDDHIEDDIDLKKWLRQAMAFVGTLEPK